jgi:hypothetical protein
MTKGRIVAAVAAAAALLWLTACHSYHIDSTIENRTGNVVRLLEVDYPSASFGVESINSGADFHYRFQVQGSGPIKVQYTGPADKVVTINGPSFKDREEGRLEIILLPGGKAEFHPQLMPHS